jgi:DNA modification methylase
MLLSFHHVVLWGANNFANRLPGGSLLVWDKRHSNGTAYVSAAEVAWMRGGHSVHLYSLTWQGFVRGSQEPHLHPTQKPIALMEWCLMKCKAGTAVYDPYAGSGPVLLACERTDRVCYATEIDPHYCDVTLRRWELATGQHAVLLDRRTPARKEAVG